MPAAIRNRPPLALVAALVWILLALGFAFWAASPASAETFAVTKTADTNDGNCSDDCSLREAVVASNAADGEDTISVPAGTYVLAIAGAGEDASATGDLDVTGALTVDGEGADVTTVSAGGEAGNTTTPDLGDRVFDVRGTPAVTISGLTASGGSGVAEGGGIHHTSGALTVTDSAVSDNQATSGGGIFNDDSDLTITRATVSGNRSGASGGGIFSDTDLSTATAIQNSTISGNSAGTSATSAGGGVFNADGLTTISNSTVTGNSANQADGVATSGAFSTSTTFDSSVVAGNSDSNDVGRRSPFDGTISSLGYNVVGGGNAVGFFSGTGDQTDVEDPGLGPLADNGGPTPTHALLSGSPAIDTIPSEECPPPAVDQRGVTRPKDGDENGTFVCDSGAFERSPGSVRFANATYTLNESGGTATVTLVREDGAEGQVFVDYTTSDGTAISGSDYTASAGTATFVDGEDSTSFTVPITNDATDEENETVNLTLSNPQGGATLGATTSAALTITDNDPAPAFSISNRTVKEGNTGTRNAVFTVTLSEASAKPVTVRYATANGTARQPADYVVRSGTLTFAPGQPTRKNVTVRVKGDRIDEPNERFSVRLSNPTNARLADGLGTGTITDDDRRRR